MPVLNAICFKMQNEIIYYCQFDNELGHDPEFIQLYNAINYVLLINKM